MAKKYEVYPIHDSKKLYKLISQSPNIPIIYTLVQTTFVNLTHHDTIHFHEASLLSTKIESLQNSRVGAFHLFARFPFSQTLKVLIFFLVYIGARQRPNK